MPDISPSSPPDFGQFLNRPGPSADSNILLLRQIRSEDTTIATFGSRAAAGPARHFMGRIVQQIKSWVSPDRPAEAGLASFRQALKLKFGAAGVMEGGLLSGKTITVGEARLAWTRAETAKAKADQKYKENADFFRAEISKSDPDEGVHKYLLDIFEPTLRGAKSLGTVKTCVNLAEQMMTRLRREPGSSPTRRRAILALAGSTGNPAAAIQVVTGVTQRDNRKRVGIDGLRVRGANLPAALMNPQLGGQGRSTLTKDLKIKVHIPGQKANRASSHKLHQNLMAVTDGEAKDLVTYTTKNGRSIPMSSLFQRDGPRNDMTFNGQLSSRGENLERLAEYFGDSPQSEEQCRLASGCLNQTMGNSVDEHILKEIGFAIYPGGDDSPDISAKDIWQERDGSWRLRGTQMRCSTSCGTLEDGQIKNLFLQKPVACLSTIEYRLEIINGRPALTELDSDLVFSAQVR